MTIDLNQPEQALQAYIKTRVSLAAEDVVLYWSGHIYSVVPGEKSRLLFKTDGYNIGRAVQTENGYQHLTREVNVYRDPHSGEILEQWANPFTQQEVSVIQVWNDPANYVYMLDGPYGKFQIPFTELGPDRLCLYSDILLAYPSPLPRAQYPQYSQSDLYQGNELFQFYVSRQDLENEAETSIPCEISWTRLGPWLPWMEMADHPGYLLYQCRGYKLAHGYRDLPANLRDYVEQRHPEYTSAPTTFTRPNETSWTYFKKHLEQNTTAQ